LSNRKKTIKYLGLLENKKTINSIDK